MALVTAVARVCSLARTPLPAMGTAKKKKKDRMKVSRKVSVLQEEGNNLDSRSVMQHKNNENIKYSDLCSVRDTLLNLKYII